MKILDMTAGRRAIWFYKQNPLVTFVDRREEVRPDLVTDCTNLPFSDSSFDLIVFDPPHMNCGPNSNMSKVYGHHTTRQILDLIENASNEAARVAAGSGLLVLKWNDHDIPLKKVFLLMPKWEPLFGHITKDGPGSKTYWVVLKKRP